MTKKQFAYHYALKYGIIGSEEEYRRAVRISKAGTGRKSFLQQVKESCGAAGNTEDLAELNKWSDRDFSEALSRSVPAKWKMKEVEEVEEVVEVEETARPNNEYTAITTYPAPPPQLPLAHHQPMAMMYQAHGFVQNGYVSHQLEFQQHKMEMEKDTMKMKKKEQDFQHEMVRSAMKSHEVTNGLIAQQRDEKEEECKKLKQENAALRAAVAAPSTPSHNRQPSSAMGTPVSRLRTPARTPVSKAYRQACDLVTMLEMENDVSIV